MLSYAVACCDKAWPKLFESQDKAARAKTGHGNGKRNVQQVTNNAYRHIFFLIYMQFTFFEASSSTASFTGTTGFIYRYQGMEGSSHAGRHARSFTTKKWLNRRKSDGI